MIISLVLYGTLIGALAAVAARALEAVGRSTRVATRWVWAGAIALTMGLVIWAGVTRPPVVRREAGPANSVALPAATAMAGVSVSPLSSALAAVRGSVAELVNAGDAMVARRAPHQTGAIVLGLWIASSAFLLGLLTTVERRGRRKSDGLPERQLHGLAVRVSETTGPAVIGLAPPRIVVPGWLLTRSVDEQRAALAHEGSHMVARDPWLLAAACTAVAIMPWNSALWYMLSRMRLAVEVDCDARVLRSGIATQSYGELLISVAEHTSAHRVGALALSGGASHLHQRIHAMTAPTRRFTRTRIAAACAVAGFAVLAACEAQLPTQADVSNMDASSATIAAKKLALVDSGHMKYYIDDVVATEAAAKALQSDTISSINIVHDRDGKSSDIRITTAAAEHQLVKRMAENMADTSLRMKRAVPVLLRGDAAKFQGLILLDGVKTDSKTLATLSAMQIASVEVLKGAAAAKESSDPAAAYGIIKITTKK